MILPFDIFGLRPSVDFATTLSKEELSVCITSLVPPGAYYAEPRMTDDVHFTHNFEPTSLIKFPRWTAGACVHFLARAVIFVSTLALV
jgi:hypothetical protein